MIARAAWLYCRLNMSPREVEDRHPVPEGMAPIGLRPATH